MEITLDALFYGKATIIKNKEYLSTKDYVEDFIKEMSKYTNKFIINVQTPSQFTFSDSSQDLTYNKVWIQAIMPESNNIEDYNEVYGLIYAIDIKIPTYKIYRGYINSETQNLCVFNPDWIQIFELKPNEKLKYSISSLMKMPSDFKIKLNKSKSTFISIEDNHKLLGEIIEKSLLYTFDTISGKIKLSPNDVINAYINIFHDTTSKYYLNNKECSYNHFYNAIAEQINDNKDIINRYEKSLLVGMLFNLVNDEDH